MRGINILAVVPFTDMLTSWTLLVFPYTNMIEKTDKLLCFFTDIFAIMTYSFASCTDKIFTYDTLVLPCTGMMWNNKFWSILAFILWEIMTNSLFVTQL